MCMTKPATRFLSFLLVILFCTASCTLQKRRYTKGFYVDVFSKRHQVPSQKNEHVNLTHTIHSGPVKADKEQYRAGQITEPIAHEAPASYPGGSESNKRIRKAGSFKHGVKVLHVKWIATPVTSYGKKTQEKDQPEYKSPKFQISALIALLLSIFILPLFVVGLFFVFASVPTGLLLMLLAFIVGLLSLALSILAMVLHFSNPGKYQGVALAYIALVVSALSLGLILVFMTGL